MWRLVLEHLPPIGRVVKTKIDDCHGVRNIQNLIYDVGLWWMEDKSMYTYYSPTHWKFLQECDGTEEQEACDLDCE